MAKPVNESEATIAVRDFLRITGNNKPSDSDEQDSDVGLDLTALITDSVRDQNPKFSISTVVAAIKDLNLASKLDALSVIPLLASSEEPHVSELLALVGDHANAKEITISVQEELERIHRSLRSLTFDSDSDEEQVSEEPGHESIAGEKYMSQIIRLLDLYAKAIPRLKLRKKSALDTLQTLFSNVAELTQFGTPFMKPDIAEDILVTVGRLIRNSLAWAKATSECTSDGPLEELKAFLYDTFSSLFDTLSQRIQMNLSRRKFISCFPRHRGMGSVSDAAQARVTADCNETLIHLSVTWDQLMRTPLGGTLPLVAYCLPYRKSDWPQSQKLVSSVLRRLIASFTGIERNVDEGLFIILSSLFPDSNSNSVDDWDSSLASPLIEILSHLSCNHPDLHIRHIAFRTVGEIVKRLPSPLERMRFIHDLLTDDSRPPMRVAAIGILKDAVIDAFAPSQQSRESPLASPLLLQMFARVVLCVDAQFKAADSQNFDDPQKVMGYKRIAENLSFYYVLISVDATNKSGVRDHSAIRTVQQDLIMPVKKALEDWRVHDDGARSPDNEKDVIIAALEMAIDRVDTVIRNIERR